MLKKISYGFAGAGLIIVAPEIAIACVIVAAGFLLVAGWVYSSVGQAMEGLEQQ